MCGNVISSACLTDLYPQQQVKNHLGIVLHQEMDVCQETVY